MARNKNNHKKLEYRGFLHIPHVVANSLRFMELHPRALKLLIDIGVQYRGNNNGDLQATKSCMEPRGWTSNDQLTQAKRELLESGLIIQTRWGGFGMSCDLFALAWQPINECGGKLDIPSTTNPPVDWMKEEKKKVAEGKLYDFKNIGLKNDKK